MTIISSQQYVNYEIVVEKMEQLKQSGDTKVIIPCTEVGEIDGVEYAIVIDKHHTMAAAKKLDIEVVFDINPDENGLTGVDLLELAHMGNDYYLVEKCDQLIGKFPPAF